jgi:tRNA A64-2'-O-ribosylphosphate transferase
MVRESENCGYLSLGERCGITKVTQASTVSAYFKSTDGHFNNWSFNLRRPNLHLLQLIQEKKGHVL